jgi:hypothetical protein
MSVTPTSSSTESDLDQLQAVFRQAEADGRALTKLKVQEQSKLNVATTKPNN